MNNNNVNEHVAIRERTHPLPLNSQDCQKMTLSTCYAFCDKHTVDKADAAPHLNISGKEYIGTERCRHE